MTRSRSPRAPRLPFPLTTPLLVLALGPSALAQVTWTSLDRRDHAMAVDLTTQAVVLFGGSKGKDRNGNEVILQDTWVLQGTKPGNRGWKQKHPSQSPPATMGHAMAPFTDGKDAAAASIVMFGGMRRSGLLSKETWSWDGNRWSVGKAFGPSARDRHKMVFDPLRNRVILFGGAGSLLETNDVWEWNGTLWNDRTPKTLPVSWPQARSSHALAYDTTRKSVLLFGGSGNTNDTWEYDPGLNKWTNISPPAPAPSPAGRRDHAMAYDALKNREMILFGGRDKTTTFNDTWALKWDALSSKWIWTQQAPTTKPPPRHGHRMQYDRRTKTVVMTGGTDASGKVLSDSWEWTGTDWTETNLKPNPRVSIKMAYDAARGEVVMFGGQTSASGALTDETWTWNGSMWRKRSPPVRPSPRFNHDMVYDSKRKVVVLWGGRGASNFTETWEWNGTIWTKLPGGPSAYEAAGLAYDSNRGVTVLFGGSNGTKTWPRETWEWNGTLWSKKNMPVANQPPPTIRHAMTYDPFRKQVVMFGGQTTGYVWVRDTWLYDGTKWTKAIPRSKNPPLARLAQGNMVFDRARGRAVLFGGRTAGRVLLNDVWEWDGSDWIQRRPPLSPVPREGHGMAYDSALGRLFTFGGQDSGKLLGDSWLYGSLYPPSYTLFGPGCPTSTKQIPALAAVPGTRAWLGTVLKLRVGNMPQSSLGLMLLGLSKDLWGRIPLPLPLPVFGNACMLRASPDLLLPPFSATLNEVAIPIPSNKSLLGQSFFNQALVLEPVKLKLSFSNGGEARIGGK